MILLLNQNDLLMTDKLDGTVVIFDVETNGVARKLRGHTRQIQGLRLVQASTSCKDTNLLLTLHQLVSRRTIPTELVARFKMHTMGSE